jgi:hypothetical protein
VVRRCPSSTSAVNRVTRVTSSPQCPEVRHHSEVTDHSTACRPMSRCLAIIAITMLIAAVGAMAPSGASAAEDVVSGTVYRDLNDDGVRSTDEPGLPGIVLRAGNRSAITDLSGSYSFTNVTQTISIRADAGWFRSQCSSAYSGPSSGAKYTATCPDPGEGAGVDQDFRVNNQLLTATASPGEDASLGLTPDWVGHGYTGYTTDPTASMKKDPALRLSPGYRMPGADANCLNAICRPLETQWVLAQWLNQGTKPLRGIRTLIVAPPGSMVTQVAPYLGHGPGTGHRVKGFNVVDAETGDVLEQGTNGWLQRPASRIRIRLKGKLLPASEYLAGVGFRMNGDAPFSDGNADGVPDCSADTASANPGQTCTLATDFGAGSYIAWGAITGLRRGGDSDAEFCPTIPDDCTALGVHNKTQPGDSNDAGAWKVDSVFAPE